MINTLKNALGWVGKAPYHYGLVSPRRLALPNFIIIGTPKSGTWWLATRIEKHPDIHLARGRSSGEIKYFNKLFHKPLTYYSSRFRDAGGRVTGEKSPNYCRISRPRIRLIRNLMPAVRLVLILRNPIERAWSEALMTLVRDSGRPLTDIPLRAIYQKLDAVTLYYSEIIHNWSTFFDHSQIHVCFYDDINTDPEGLLRGVFQHIGVNPDIDYGALDMDEVINPGTGIHVPGPCRGYLAAVYREEIRRMRRVWGARVQPWLDDARGAG